MTTLPAVRSADTGGVDGFWMEQMNSLGENGSIPKASTALSRFTVLDLTRVRAGPTCVRQFADWGANVIKVELPEEGDSDNPSDFSARHTPDFQNLHRNKRSLSLNLKSPKGVEILKRLVEQADVLVENYRPDVKRPARHRLRDAARGQSTAGLHEHLGVRPGRPLRAAAGCRPDRPGHGRPYVDHR